MSFLDEILQKEREDYLAVWMSSLSEYRSKSSNVVAEVLLEINSDKNPLVHRYHRIDIVHGGPEAPKLVDINKSRYFDFEPVDFMVGSTRCQLSPFHWNGIELHVYGGIELGEDFEKWIHAAIDVDDLQNVEGQDLSFVVHNVTAPQREEAYVSFSVDMGSAQPERFLELLTLLSNHDPDEIKIGSFSMINCE